MPALRPLKTALIQLPIPDVHNFYLLGNIPLAAGYLKSWAVRNAGFSRDQIEILPRWIANHGGDAAIVKWVMDSGSDVVGFTCYQWNIERNCRLARIIKVKDPRIKIFFGGPEIAPDHPILDEMSIDSFFIGEGEAIFSQALNDIHESGKSLRVYQASMPIDLRKNPNPYLDNTINYYPDESILFETLRGCPYRCSYCYYGKSFQDIRQYSEHQLQQLLTHRDAAEFSKIYLMDPSFNTIPNLHGKLENIEKWNLHRIPIHTEVRLEKITKSTARLMKRAGITSVEVGLQSTNSEALKTVRRNLNKKKFIEGAARLKDAGIDIVTGIILGLPRDNVDTILETLRFVKALGLAELMEIYPLSVLPGTDLQKEAQKLNLNYMDKPPYWVLSNGLLEASDLTKLVRLVENELDIDLYPPITPEFSHSKNEFIRFVDLRNPSANSTRELISRPHVISNRLTILLKPDCDLDELRTFGGWIQDQNPFTLVHLVVETDSIPPLAFAHDIRDCFFKADQFFDRMYFYKADPQGIFSVRIFLLTSKIRTARKILDSQIYYDLVLNYQPGMVTSAEDILVRHPILLVSRDIGSWEKDRLREIYTDHPHLLVLN